MNNIELQTIILRELLTNDSFTRKTIPFIKPEYFEGVENYIFKETAKFFLTYHERPKMETLLVEIKKKKLKPEKLTEIIEALTVVFEKKEVDEKWLVVETEKWCQTQALNLAILKSYSIIESPNKSTPRSSIRDIVSDALNVGFDRHVGHDYFNDIEARYESYHTNETKIPFDLDIFNKITSGGISKKTLNIIIGGTGIGKTMMMTHMTAGHIKAGYNVLYITAEMEESKIAERIDSNIMDINITDVSKLPKPLFFQKINALKKKSTGRLFIKEYPTSTPTTLHFEALLNELAIKKHFVPDIIYIDYINICNSSRGDTKGGSYMFVKYISEEFRGLSMKYGIPIITATQFNRRGCDSNMPELTDIAESFGVTATADLLFAINTNEQLEQEQKIQIIQFKNRYSDINPWKTFCVGLDRRKMKFFNLKEDYQNDPD